MAQTRTLVGQRNCVVTPLRRRMFSARASSVGRNFDSVFELARSLNADDGWRRPSFDRIFEVYASEAACTVGAKLAEKYSKHATEGVMKRRLAFSFDQTWFNAERSRKPQNFISTEALKDPTVNGALCDFCDACNLTAVDDFGRVLLPNVISGSNLFKYCAPGHGVLVFKKHHPLEFEMQDVRELMQCTQEWLNRAAQMHPHAKYPLFVWNCLARAGASQFHGHAQVMLSAVPFPCYEKLRAAEQSYAAHDSSRSYQEAVFSAYKEVGLLQTLQKDSRRCVVYPSLTPWKDMEVVICSPVLSVLFAETLFTVLKTLMTEFGMQTFNVGIQGIPLGATTSADSGGVLARVVSRGKVSSQASDFGGLEVFGGASIGHTDPFLIGKALQTQFKNAHVTTA